MRIIPLVIFSLLLICSKALPLAFYPPLAGVGGGEPLSSNSARNYERPTFTMNAVSAPFNIGGNDNHRFPPPPPPASGGHSSSISSPIREDSILTNKELAEKQIIQLHDGTLVVRLKTNDRSIAAYRREGQKKLANKLELQYRAVNLYLMKAFMESYNFSNVLFIKAEDSHKLVEQRANVFLNGRLEIDTSIKMDNKPFFLAEYGTLMSNYRVDDKSFANRHSEATSNPSTSAALLISDTTLTQLKEPFPFFEVLDFSDYFVQAGGQGLKKEITKSDSLRWAEQKSLANTRDSTPTFQRKTMYRLSVWRLNKGLIKYYVKIADKLKIKATDDLLEWEHNNPNKYTAEKWAIIDRELSKVVDDSKFLTK